MPHASSNTRPVPEPAVELDRRISHEGNCSRNILELAPLGSKHRAGFFAVQEQDCPSTI